MKNPYWAFFTISIHGVALWYLVLNVCYFIRLNRWPPFYLIAFPFLLLLIVSLSLLRMIEKYHLHSLRIHKLFGAAKRDIVRQIVIQALLLSLVSGLVSSISFDLFFPLTKGLIKGSEFFNWNSVSVKLIYLAFTFLSGLLISILPVILLYPNQSIKPINTLKPI